MIDPSSDQKAHERPRLGEAVGKWPYFVRVRCGHCGWTGSSEHCGTVPGWDDGDVTCPSCGKASLREEAEA